MSASQIFLTIFEFSALILAIIALFNESAIADFERKAAKRIVRYFVRRSNAKRMAKQHCTASNAGKHRTISAYASAPDGNANYVA